MENVITISRPYATAVFETALEAQNKTEALDFWNDVLDICNYALTSENGKTVLAKYSKYQHEIRKFLWAVLPDKYHTEQVDNFLHILRHFNRFEFIPGILKTFIELRQNYDLPVPVTIITACELQETQIESIGLTVATKLDRKIQLEIILDPSILSGIIIKTEEFTIDCSGKKNLENLRNLLYR